jgi:diaminohydroxyphosphoribosylaminopyrimidine deaminase/5-amino-6-(5-phosphoribosylamino)uracil reductase
MKATEFNDVDHQHMQRALALAECGRGLVEPNPLVGCVIAEADRVLAEGYHQRFGEAHAEINALRQCSSLSSAATMYVTLEPCCHHGKTPPCVEAILHARISRVVVAMPDPFAQVSGRGIKQLRSAGITVDVGLLESAARSLNAPYLKLIQSRRPWVIGKWAMTLDGKIASSTGDSQWISGKASRQLVHKMRGCVDAIMVGRNTAQRDDPLLTARPAGPRTATRIVLDSTAQLPLCSQLVRTADDAPVLIAVGTDADPARCQQLAAAGCEVWQSTEPDCNGRLLALLDELGSRSFSNVLVEGGGQLLGSLLDTGQLDEAHVFVANKLIGGSAAISPLAGVGLSEIGEALCLDQAQCEMLDDDIYVHGHVVHVSDDS